MTSEEFSDLFIEDNLTFIVGGSNGVDESKFNNKISFSKMTFPHQMFRLMLIEQIYRGLAIKKNIKYHK
ncbi:Ribosomal RNA large subunit methyltransferase H [Chlamydia trachomatis]|nr:Ribosomal RNA large subunit methyltransferase H [Chlamydia trachomatis]